MAIASAYALAGAFRAAAGVDDRRGVHARPVGRARDRLMDVLSLTLPVGAFVSVSLGLVVLMRSV